MGSSFQPLGAGSEPASSGAVRWIPWLLVTLLGSGVAGAAERSARPASGRPSIVGLRRADADFDPRNPPPERNGFLVGAGRSLELHVGGRVLPMALRRYGFPRGRTVKLTDDRLTGFAPEAQVAYDGLMARGVVSLPRALGTITRAVNRSMAYDLDGLPAALQAGARATGYRLRGDETCVGRCGDAGGLIRAVLDRSLDDPSLETFATATSIGGAAHDVTIVRDRQHGSWAVLNSLSPLKPFDLVPRHRLELFGAPFVRPKNAAPRGDSGSR